MRGLLRQFADGGGTVLLSSHLLGEVHALADRLVVIAGGTVRAAGDTSVLLEGHDDLEEYYFALTTAYPGTPPSLTTSAPSASIAGATR